MNEDVMTILFFLAISGFVLFRLYKMLGQKMDGDFKGPAGGGMNRANQSKDNMQDSDAEIGSHASQGVGSLQRDPAAGKGAKPVLEMPDIARINAELEIYKQMDERVAANIQAIAKQDRDFNILDFVDGAKKAFEYIVAAFAHGDVAMLKQLLAPEIFEDFAADIAERNQKEERLETTILAITRASIINASLIGKEAKITLEIESEQTSILRDKSGEVIEGDPSHIEQLVDVWTFSRHIHAEDLTWFLVETA